MGAALLHYTTGVELHHHSLSNTAIGITVKKAEKRVLDVQRATGKWVLDEVGKNALFLVAPVVDLTWGE